MPRILVWCTSAIGVVVFGMLSTMRTSALSAWQRTLGITSLNGEDYDSYQQVEQTKELNRILSQLDTLFEAPRTTRTSSTTTTTTTTQPPQEVHLMVLVHGFLGNALELDYLKLALEREAGLVTTTPLGGGTEETTKTTTMTTTPSLEQQEDTQEPDEEKGPGDTCDTTSSSSTPTSNLLVYRAHANTGRTFDGVAAGGSRLANEINTVLEQVQQRLVDKSSTTTTGSVSGSNSPKLTLSFVGHSLGGLYSRYSLSEIKWNWEVKTNHNDNNNDKDDDSRNPAAEGTDTVGASLSSSSSGELSQSSHGTFHVEPRVFCSTASPHLGLHQQVSIPVPRFLEKTVGYTLQQTGQDLFRMSTILNQMAMDATFLQPLAAFDTRLAYANAYGTDFQVPSVTAAFVADDDESILHTLLEQQEDDEDFIALRAQTPRKPSLSDDLHDDTTSISSSISSDNDSVPLRSEPQKEQPLPEEVPNSILARHLDALGWTKVWIDVRELIPNYRSSSSSVGGDDEDDHNNSDSDNLSCKALLQSKEVTSRQLFRSPLNRLNDLTRTFPMGHTVMVANSKSEWYASLNAGGRPVMDRLAKDLIQTIFYKKKTRFL